MTVEYEQELERTVLMLREFLTPVQMQWMRFEHPGMAGLLERLRTSKAPAFNSEYVIPTELADADAQARTGWLLMDAEADDRMAGVPRHQPRYTPREHQIIHILRVALDPGPEGAP